MSDASKRKEKQKLAIEKTKLDNVRRLRAIYFIDPDDEEFKDIMKNARRKLEIPMPAAMPCKLQRDKYRETCRTVEEHKTKYKYACIVEADESMRTRMEGSPHKNHEDRIAGQGIQFIEPLQFGAQIYSDASSNENTRCKGSSRERMGKLVKLPALQLTKVKNESEVIAEARNEGRTIQ